ncbi:hypothetical protein ILYODFUR_035149, partial [Ilyodon furcidens]
RKWAEKEEGRHAAKLPGSGIEPRTAASRTIASADGAHALPLQHTMLPLAQPHRFYSPPFPSN